METKRTKSAPSGKTSGRTRQRKLDDHMKAPVKGFGLLIALMVGLSGCANLSAVKDYAAISQQASQQFPTVAAVGYQSCIDRQRYIQLMDVENFNKDFTYNQSAAESACSEAKRAMGDLEQANKVLVNYLTTLGKLSAGETPALSDSVKGLAQQATPLAGFTTSQQTAVKNLAGVVSDAVVGIWRQHEVRKFIESAQPHVHAVCTVLEDNISAFVQQHVQSKREQLVALYRQVDAASGTSPVLLTKNLEDDLLTLDANLNSLATLKAIYEKIDKGHTELYNNRNDLTKNKTVQQMFQISAGIADQLAQLNKAFK